ncbi:MAG: hypothetical protein JNL44_18390, partial [Gemmatimonadetes bacterium]|nr:hypothetical protein [Gemmatimonadota bacterium]
LLALALMPVSYPEWLDTLLRRLAATLVPLALVSVGFQLRLSQIRGRLPLLALGMGFKLVIGPALVLAVLAGLLGQRGPVIQVTVFEAAMGPMIGAAIVAMDHDLDPSLVTLMVGLGIPLSFATLPVWWWLLQPLAAAVGGSTEWIVVPDGPLGQLPFEALPWGAGARPLSDSVELRHAPSMSVWRSGLALSR